MKEIKTVFDKFDLDEEKSNEIRSKLVSEKHVSHVWLIPVAAVLAAMVMIMVIPVTRNKVVNAAERIFKYFHHDMVDGVEIEWGTDPDTGEEYQWAEYRSDKEVELVRVKEGRLYLVLGDEWTDITDKCSATKYYRHEIVHEDGVKEVILIGGVPERHKYGWIEIIYDSEGKTRLGVYHIPYSSPKQYPDCEEEDFEWVKPAVEAEGQEYFRL